MLFLAQNYSIAIPIAFWQLFMRDFFHELLMNYLKFGLRTVQKNLEKPVLHGLMAGYTNLDILT